MPDNEPIICRECNCYHQAQREQFPKGARVVAIAEIEQGGGVPTLPIGVKGRVSGHCNDGRACIIFDDNGPSHTFHFANDFIRTE